MSVKELVEAAGEGDVASIERLVAAGVELDGQRVSDGRCALHEASARGHLAVVSHLVKLGASLEIKDDNYLTPLLHAAAAGHLPILKHLIECGADLHAIAEGRSALQLARTFNHDATAAYLDPLFRNQRNASSSSHSSASGSSSSHHYAQPPPPSSSSSSSSYSPTNNYSSNSSSTFLPVKHPTERGEILILVEMNGEVIGVADVSRNTLLASLRRQMREDNLSSSSSFRFLYQGTGAPITERQESRFLVDDCIIADSPLPRLKLTPVSASSTL